MRGSLLAVLLFVGVPMSSYAHPEGFSGVHVTITPEQVRAQITLHTRDLGTWFPPRAYPDYVADVTRAMEQTVGEMIELRLDDQPLAISGVQAFELEVGLLEIQVDWPLPAAAEPVELLVWSKHLIHLPRGHQQLLYVEDRRELMDEADQGLLRLEDVLTVDRDAGALLLPPLEDPVPRPDPPPSGSEPPGSSPAAPPSDAGAAAMDARQPRALPDPPSAQPSSRISFFLFGVEHILTGYDHLLFLAALLLTCTTVKEVVTIITCFTVSHSVTLALAALNVVQLPAAIVEPAIALSIIFVAVENLFGTPPLWRRAAITGIFGLVHGLGFASALRDIGLGTVPGGVLWPLLKFNLGVEAGQLCVAAVFLPLLAIARKNKMLEKYLVPVGSSLVALCGVYWLIGRVL